MSNSTAVAIFCILLILFSAVICIADDGLYGDGGQSSFSDKSYCFVELHNGIVIEGMLNSKFYTKECVVSEELFNNKKTLILTMKGMIFDGKATDAEITVQYDNVEELTRYKNFDKYPDRNPNDCFIGAMTNE